MEINVQRQIKMIVFSSLFTALFILGAYVAVPIGQIPITLQNLFVFLAALLLGSRWGTLSVIVYLLLGLAGLPVFSQGRSSFIHLIGPGGGYLVAFVFAVFLAGLISEKGKQSVVMDCAALVVAVIVIYAIGVPWLAFRAGITWDKAMLTGMAPFLIPDAVKVAAAVVLARFIRPLMNEFVLPKGTDAQGS
jgi:biotin transport system substrate-specific component